MTGTTVRTVRYGRTVRTYDRYKGRTGRTVRNDRSFDRTHAKIKLQKLNFEFQKIKNRSKNRPSFLKI